MWFCVWFLVMEEDGLLFSNLIYCQSLLVMKLHRVLCPHNHSSFLLRGEWTVGNDKGVSVSHFNNCTSCVVTFLFWWRLLACCSHTFAMSVLNSSIVRSCVFRGFAYLYLTLPRRRVLGHDMNRHEQQTLQDSSKGQARTLEEFCVLMLIILDFFKEASEGNAQEPWCRILHRKLAWFKL